MSFNTFNLVLLYWLFEVSWFFVVHFITGGIKRITWLFIIQVSRDFFSFWWQGLSFLIYFYITNIMIQFKSFQILVTWTIDRSINSWGYSIFLFKSMICLKDLNFRLNWIKIFWMILNDFGSFKWINKDIMMSRKFLSFRIKYFHTISLILKLLVSNILLNRLIWGIYTIFGINWWIMFT